MSVSYGGDSITFADNSTIGSGWTGFKNRIINGAITINQRYPGASANIANNSQPSSNYTVDRFSAYNDSATGWFTVAQSTNAPAGFKNSLYVTTGASTGTPGSTIGIVVRYCVEGNDVADCNFGTANAAQMTLSFWVRSSITGVHSGSFNNGAYDRSYPFTYTINSADTWEKKSITFTGDQTGTWVTDTGIGLRIYFDMGSGTGTEGTAATWQSGSKLRVSGSARVAQTVGATWYMTGLQLEKGSTASSFDYRPYATELQLCQRYYERIYGDSVNGGIYTAVMNGTTSVDGFVTWKVQKRSAPTVTGATGTGYVQGEIGATSYTTNGFTAAYQPSTQGARVRAVSTTTQTNASAGSFILANSSMWIDALSEL